MQGAGGKARPGAGQGSGRGAKRAARWAGAAAGGQVRLDPPARSWQAVHTQMPGLPQRVGFNGTNAMHQMLGE